MASSSSQFLNQLKKGDTGKVLDLNGPDLIVARLQELGVVRGASIAVVEILTFGEPIVVDVDDVRMALRKFEASCISVEPRTDAQS